MSRFNPPPGWLEPPAGWPPPADWSPDPSWPPAPPGWSFWSEDEVGISVQGQSASLPSATARSPGDRSSALSRWALITAGLGVLLLLSTLLPLIQSDLPLQVNPDVGSATVFWSSLIIISGAMLFFGKAKAPVAIIGILLGILAGVIEALICVAIIFGGVFGVRDSFGVRETYQAGSGLLLAFVVSVAAIVSCVASGVVMLRVRHDRMHLGPGVARPNPNMGPFG